jgi:hypothetical protein
MSCEAGRLGFGDRDDPAHDIDHGTWRRLVEVSHPVEWVRIQAA